MEPVDLAGVPISVMHAFPPDIAGTQADLYVDDPNQPGAVNLPIVIRHNTRGQRAVVIFDHEGAEIWHLDLDELRTALAKAADLIGR